MNQLLACLVLVAACGDSSETNDPICGDAVVEGSEQCDDGNVASGDGCSATCTREPRCGDTFVDGTEQCDDGNTVAGDGCSATCVLECGNGMMDPGEECDDGDRTPFDGCSDTCTIEGDFAISASWQLRNYAGTTQVCPQGYDTAALYSQPIDANGNPVGAVIIDLFDCAANAGTTGPLKEGRYNVFLGITTSNGSMTYAKSASALVVLDANKSFSASIYTDAGYFQLAWSLIGAMSNNSLTCTQAGATGGVELVSTLSSSTMAISDIFDCEDHSGITAAIPAGTYTVSTAALNSSDQSIGTAPALTNKQVMAPNKITDLGTVTIPIDGK